MKMIHTVMIFLKWMTVTWEEFLVKESSFHTKNMVIYILLTGNMTWWELDQEHSSEVGSWKTIGRLVTQIHHASTVSTVYM